MSHKMPEPRIFKHQKLMNEFNEMMIRIKLHLFFNGGVSEFIEAPEPTNEELDDITNKIIKVLQKDSKPMIKH
jgi:hypothetical protein